MVLANAIQKLWRAEKHKPYKQSDCMDWKWNVCQTKNWGHTIKYSENFSKKFMLIFTGFLASQVTKSINNGFWFSLYLSASPSFALPFLCSSRFSFLVSASFLFCRKVLLCVEVFHVGNELSSSSSFCFGVCCLLL